MSDTGTTTASEAALDAANTATIPDATGATETPPTTPKVAKATDIFGEIESDIKNMTRAEQAASQPREKGKFVKAPGDELIEATEVEPIEAAATTDEEVPAVETPETEPVAEPKKLAAEFTVHDDEGELEIPEIKLSFTANKKEFKDVPLDRVVKLAQWGAYNEEREQQVRETREQFPVFQQQIDELQRQNAAYGEAYRQLFENEEFFIQSRNEYINANTPEAKLQQIQAEREQERRQNTEQAQAQEIQTQGRQFGSYLASKLDALHTQNPTVSPEEVMGKWSILTAPLFVAGVLPPHRFAEVDRLVDTELSQWIESQHQKRSTATQQKTAEVANAKRQLARAVAPRGTTPGITPAKPTTQKPYVKATDILADIPNIVSQAVA